MSSFKRAAISGMRFQIEESPLAFYQLKHFSGDFYEILCNGKPFGSATLSYKHLNVEVVYHGIRFRKEIRLKDLNFVPEKT